MLILINNQSGIPIYEQIYSQIKENIINNTLKENESLPSIRNLAKDLQISVITTKRAYEELEKEGFIYTIKGKGSFVAKKNIELVKEENLKQIENNIEEIIKLSKICNLTKEDIIEMFNLFYEESLS